MTMGRPAVRCEHEPSRPRKRGRRAGVHDPEPSVRGDRGSGSEGRKRRRGTASAGVPEGVVVEQPADLIVGSRDENVGLGPHLGALPPELLRLVLLELDDLSLIVFARAAGACWRAVKDARLSRSPRGIPGWCEQAARDGRLRVLQYLREEGCPWDMWTCYSAAQYGHLECLRYARENGCPWDEETCSRAASGGRLECLRYLHENGCPWDETTCWQAAAGGHLKCLRYAHENGCPWDDKMSAYAAEGGNLDCLKYVRENGCPLHVSTCLIALENNHLECLRYAREFECSWLERS